MQPDISPQLDTSQSVDAGTSDSPAEAQEVVTARPLEDWSNLLLIVGAFALLLLIIPPAHEYPIIDDWIYAGSVKNMLDTGGFAMPPMTQANLVGLTAWGAIWSKLFGFSFTTLTASTLFFALVALLTFYGIARLLNVPPWGALFGTGLFMVNPHFVHLSYSFMTDVPFVSLSLLASYCYIKGIKGDEGRRTKDEGRRTKDETRRTIDKGHSALNTQHSALSTQRLSGCWLGVCLRGGHILSGNSGCSCPYPSSSTCCWRGCSLGGGGGSI